MGGEKKEHNTPINSDTNYHREIKFIRIIMDYCLLQFNALQFFWGGPSSSPLVNLKGNAIINLLTLNTLVFRKTS